MMGEDATLTLEWPVESVSIEVIPITDTRLRSIWPDKFYRIQVTYEHTLKARIR